MSETSNQSILQTPRGHHEIGAAGTCFITGTQSIDLMALEKQRISVLLFLVLSLLALVLHDVQAFNFGNFGGGHHNHEQLESQDVDFYESTLFLATSGV